MKSPVCATTACPWRRALASPNLVKGHLVASPQENTSSPDFPLCSTKGTHFAKLGDGRLLSLTKLESGSPEDSSQPGPRFGLRSQVLAGDPAKSVQHLPQTLDTQAWACLQSESQAVSLARTPGLPSSFPHPPLGLKIPPLSLLCSPSRAHPCSCCDSPE